MWIKDLVYAFRSIAKKPGFAAVAVFSLAIGIGATVTIFSFVDTYLLRPMPHEEPDSLVHIWNTTRQSSSARVSAPNFIDWRRQSEVFEDMAAFNYTIETLNEGEFPRYLPRR
jgi:putative ABC transport system permease protein